MKNFKLLAFLTLEKLWLLVLCGLSIPVLGQQMRTISTHQNMLRLEQIDSNLSANRAQINAFLSQSIPDSELVQNPVIPLVFHVVYNDVNKKVSATDIQDQLDILNFEFGMPNIVMNHPALSELDYAARKAHLPLSFCLADLGGNQDAINFYPTTQTAFGLNDEMKSTQTGGAAPIDPSNYLNIWIVDLEGRNAGFAQMPGADTLTDGIVIDYEYFGTSSFVNTPYHLGKTLVHLMGNYFGLYALWGETRCTDDFIEDTPIHNAPNYGIPAFYHYSTCGNMEVEMSMNFMDNSDDEHLQMFTRGQIYRIYAGLRTGGPRAGLLNGNTDCNQVASAAPEGENPNLIWDEPAPFSKDQLSVYPNPSDNEFTVQVNMQMETTFHIEIYNLSGQLIHQIQNIEAQPQQINIDASAWEAGVYLMHATQKGQKIYSSKLIKIKK